MASRAELKRRYELVAEATRDAGYAALIVAGNSEFNQRGYIRYLADWRLFGGTGYLILTPVRDPIFVLGLGSQAEWAKELSAVADTRAVLSKIDETVNLMRELGHATSRIGVVGMDTVMPHGDAKRLAAGLPGAQLEDATALLEAIMVVLSEEEVGEVEIAHNIVERVFDAFYAALAPGRSEREVVAEAYQVAVQQGCFEGMIHLNNDAKSGTRPASDRRFQIGDITKMYMEFLTPAGYLIELGGVFSFSEPPANKERKFDIVVKAIEHAIAATKPGMKAGELVDIIRQLYVDEGWEISGRRLWDFHGQGMHSLLPPYGLPGSQEEFKENMMINIHPGILTADGWGVSATNNYIVTRQGGRALGNFKHRWRRPLLRDV